MMLGSALTGWAWTVKAVGGGVRCFWPGNGTDLEVRRMLPVALNEHAGNWHGPGESDCLIKTKHCDGP